MKRKTLSVSMERHLKVERVAIELSAKIGQRVSWSDLVNHLIDNYLKEAEADYIHAKQNLKTEH